MTCLFKHDWVVLSSARTTYGYGYGPDYFEINIPKSHPVLKAYPKLQELLMADEVDLPLLSVPFWPWTRYPQDRICRSCEESDLSLSKAIAASAPMVVADMERKEEYEAELSAAKDRVKSYRDKFWKAYL